ncbi:flagellar MS-ring protein [Rubripirellula amarantea]|uniref:Flagellar MS-ring protein n=1 Tax=Rubripirellula amarantea TaxID=2527999 RepID=A0A5C5WQD4_9BACT|nr:beta-cystathionase [Rubripirellula amarantea]TWT52996.1 flagellar MS-ring protein [Rubripirellula amarantea]
MSFFKESSDQAREAFVSMPMQSRVIVVMLGLAITIGLAFLVRGDNSSGKEFLFGGQSFGSQELAAVERAFSRAGLGDWKREGSRIQIPSQNRSDYLAALEDSSSLPMSMRSRVQDAIDATTVFDSSDLREAREMVAKEQELAATIMAFPEIMLAKVEHDRGERIGLGRATPQVCSVFVVPEGSSALPRGRILAIKDLIQASYAGLGTDDIQVIDANSPTASSLSDDEDPMLRKQKEAEMWIDQKVKKLLLGYPATIAVTAEIDPQMDVEKTTLKYDAEPTNLFSKNRKIESTTNQPQNRGVPGAVPNAIGNRPQSIEETVETSRVKEDDRESRGVAGQEYENSRLASLQVKRVTVSIGLPPSFYRQQYITQELQLDNSIKPEDIKIDETKLTRLKSDIEKRIQAIVTPLLPGVAAGDDAFPLVTVKETVDLPTVAAAPPQTAKIALNWLAQSWQTIALVFLGLAALLVARSAAKGSGSTPPEFNEGFGLELPQPPAEPEEEVEEGDSMTITGGTLKEELLGLVEDNPEVAANVIRSWIGEAA